MGIAPLAWTGPFRVRDLLDRCLADDQPWPPNERGVYLVAQRPWSGAPSSDCGPLYFGGNTGRSARFCTRIGDLIADMHGFYGASTGHHSGGQSLYRWCRERGVKPGSLWLGWATREPWCGACAEVELARELVGRWERRGEVGVLNAKRPPRCGVHGAVVG